MIVHSMLRHIKHCDKAGDCLVLADENKSRFTQKNEASISLVYVLGALGAKENSKGNLWYKSWGRRLLATIYLKSCETTIGVIFNE